MPAEQNRRVTLADGISEKTGITDAMISELVDTFYGRVRQDPLLAPVFARVENWDEHLATLRKFWSSSVVLMSGQYHGRPMQAHFPLSIDPSHFDRWLALFEQTASDVCPSDAAAVFLEKAQRIADSFEMARASQRGEIASARHSTYWSSQQPLLYLGPKMLEPLTRWEAEASVALEGVVIVSAAGGERSRPSVEPPGLGGAECPAPNKTGN